MKKVVALVLCLSIVFFCAACYADDTTTVAFDATFTKAADQTAKEWMSSDETKALFTVCATLDYVLSLGEEDPPFELSILTNNTYVGRSGYIVMTMILSSDQKQGVALMYHTVTNEAAYAFYEFPGRAAAEAGLDAACGDGWSKNDVSDVYEMYSQVQSLFSE